MAFFLLLFWVNEIDVVGLEVYFPVAVVAALPLVFSRHAVSDL